MKITITAAGAKKNFYTGSLTGSFKVIDKSQKLSAAKLGKKLTVKYSGQGNVQLSAEDLSGLLYVNRKTGSTTTKAFLEEGIDFEVVGYTNNNKAGTAKVTLRGIGLFGGLKTVSFKIDKVKKK